MSAPSSFCVATWSWRVTRTVAASLALLAATVPTASARSSVVVLADNYAADQRAALDYLMVLLIDGQKPGDRLTVLSARGGTRITTLEIPDQPAYQQVQHRLPLLRSNLAKIRAALDAAVAAGAPLDSSAPSQLNLPALIEPLRYHVSSGEPLRLMLVGTPQHDDRARAPAFSMASAVPEGNHVGQPLTASPYGLAGREGSLPVQVDWCSTESERAWLNEQHRNGVQQFWAGYLSYLGGRLMTMTPDLPMCAARFVASMTEQAPAIPPQSEAPPVMAQVQPALTLPAASLQGDQAALLTRMGLPAQQVDVLRSAIEAGKVRLLEVEVYDTEAEDGDVVGIRVSGGIMVRIALKKAPTRVIIPVEDQALTVVALVDGAGGGATLGIRLPSAIGRGQDVHTPRMAVGQTLRIPVRLQ